jgi:predicted RNase H-like HicB family nuclease
LLREGPNVGLPPVQQYTRRGKKIPDWIAVERGCLDGSRDRRSICYHAIMPKTLTYTLTFDSHPDEGGYLAFFPALPGCHTWGATEEEAVRNAEEILIGYLEALRKNGEANPEQEHAAGQVSLSVSLGERRVMEVAA